MTIGALLADLLWLYLLVLVARLILDYVVMFNRGFRPTGAVAVLFEVVFTLTDPPLRALRRVVPPLRLGTVSLDLGFLILFIVIQVLINVVRPL